MKFINLENNLVTVFKVVRKYDPKNIFYSSAVAIHPNTITIYAIGQWTRANPNYLKYGYGIFAFEDFKTARSFYVGVDGDEITRYRLFEAKTSELIPIKESLTTRLYWSPQDRVEEIEMRQLNVTVPKVSYFPRGTVFCKDLILIKEIKL